MTEETPFTPYEIQRALGVQVDGKWGPETETAARKFLNNPKDNTGRPWTAKRLILGIQQKIMADAGVKIEIDGLPGMETFEAFDKWRELALKLPEKPTPSDVKKAVVEAGMGYDLWQAISSYFRREEKKEPAPVVITPAEPKKPAVVQPTVWPRQKDVISFYGPHGVPGGHLVRVPCPWQLELSWEPQTKVISILIHEKCAKSLERVLKAQIEHYGEAGLRQLGVHKYGGSFNDRKMRGANTWSMHAYGCAIDFDPDNNQLNWGHTRARLAKADAEAWWKIWEAEGWVSLGRERDMDWQHVQAARL